MAVADQVLLLSGAGALLVIAAVAVAVRHREDLSRYHVAAALLVLVGVAAFVGPASALHRANQVEYSVHACGDGRLTTPPSTDAVVAYDDLSPAAQDVFRRTLAADGSYRTTRRPDDLAYLSDVYGPEHVNFVQYRGTCQAFIADVGFGGGLLVVLLLPPLVLIGALYGMAGVNAFTRPRPLYPTAMVIGSLTVVAYAVALRFGHEWGGWWETFAVLVVAVGVGYATWRWLRARVHPA